MMHFDLFYFSKKKYLWRFFNSTFPVGLFQSLWKNVELYFCCSFKKKREVNFEEEKNTNFCFFQLWHTDKKKPEYSSIKLYVAKNSTKEVIIYKCVLLIYQMQMVFFIILFSCCLFLWECMYFCEVFSSLNIASVNNNIL